MKVHLPGVHILRLVVFSNPGAIPYTLLAFNDVRDGDPVRWLGLQQRSVDQLRRRSV